MFIAGTETTSTSISWALLLLLTHPHIQHKCHQQINQVLGSGRAPMAEDRAEMTYVEATCMEVLRWASIAPVSVPHGVEQVRFLVLTCLH